MTAFKGAYDIALVAFFALFMLWWARNKGL